MDFIFNNSALFAFGSFTIALLTVVVKFWSNWTEIKNIKIMSGLGITLTFLFLIAAGLLGYSLKKLTIEKKRIVILLPCNNELGDAWDDGVRQILGITEFFRFHHSYTKEYEFRFVDHSMQYDGLNSKLAEEIIEEIENGTKYFICTMSKVSVPLSKDFERIIKSSKYKGEKPILLSTVASSPNVSTNTENIFRYYIRSSYESKFLAKKGIENNYKKSSFIVVSGDYGDGAIKTFSKEWEANKGIIQSGLKLNDKLDYEMVRKEVQQHSHIFKESDVIFLAHYGSGVQKVVKALHACKINKPIIATHTITIPEWRKPIEHLLEEMEVHSCLPKFLTQKSSQYPKVVFEDMIGGFMYLTLDKLIRTIDNQKLKKGSFSESWEQEFPKIIETQYQTDGDYEILLNYQ